MSVEQVIANVESEREAALERLFSFLRIPSISTDPAFAKDCDAAADWLVAQLTEIGFEASKRPTPGHPMVVAHHRAEGPHMLFYGHYDVQPVDPLNLWHRDPFDPAIEEQNGVKVIRGRGTADDKGQLMTFVEAFRAWKAVHGTLPGNLTLLFEGEEESGSPSLVPFLEENREELSADIAHICDTGLFDAKTPAICTMLRGLASCEFTVRGADRDLHSGFFGGPAMNPIRVLSNLIAAMHDEHGRVTIPDFYDGVDPVPNAIKAAWDTLDFDGAALLGSVDLSEPAGEKDYSILEQIWARPTAEVNGIWGGYTGAGFKTVLPSEASAKVSFRLVGRQDPHAILKNFEDFLRQRLPVDVKLDFRPGGASRATVMPTDEPAFEISRKALSEAWPNEAVFVGGGGSIPIAGHFREILGMDSVLIGFSRDDDGLHSPNEKYDLESFQRGTESWVRILGAMQTA
ncbi:dipeptidase [Oceanibium sediminis]|uniref:dipeptidase n=1 Tax=Oceanibium sediminis TaxID=2026339 RepID=UPI000DD39167|nr:dipeptidase [Oceanibium sediminis]